MGATVIKLPHNRPTQREQSARKECARLWNDMMRLHKYIRRRRWKWPTQGDFEKHFKGRYRLHSQSVQAEIKRFFSNLETTKTNRANGDRQARYPYREKKWRPVIWKGQAVKCRGNRLILPRKKGMPPIKVRIPDTLAQSKITQVELDFRELRLTVENDGVSHGITAIPSGIAAGDPGVIRLLTLTDGNETLSINGKALRSELQRHNKTKGDLISKRSRCKKGSRQYRKYSKALAKSYQRWENWQRNFLHHSANMVSEWVLERQIAELVVGDIAGIGRGKKGKSSRRNNQDLSGIPWGRFFNLLKYKLQRVGCVLKKVDESYTTQTCPACGHRHKPAKRLYRCSNPSCGFEGVRDEVGAANTLTKYVMDGVIVPGFIVPFGNIKYRRPVKSCNKGKSCNKVGRRRCVDAHLGDSIPVLPANTFARSQISCRSNRRLGSLPREEQAHCAAPTVV